MVQRSLLVLILSVALGSCGGQRGRLAADAAQDSVDLLVAAVRGFKGPNGPAVALLDEFLCYPARDTSCNEREGEFGTTGQPASHLLQVVADSLGVELRSARPRSSSVCPWYGTANQVGAGLTVEVGRLLVREDTAEVTVLRACRSTGRYFDEAQTLKLIRQGEEWTIAELLGGWIT